MKIAGLLAGAAIFGYAVIRVFRARQRAMQRTGTEVEIPDLVEVASMQSFPASDPPSWIGMGLS